MKHWRWILICSCLVLALSAAFADDLGVTDVVLDGTKVKAQETNLGNFVADAIKNTSKADIAIIHAGMFRANALIPVGVVDEAVMRKTVTNLSSAIFTLKMTPSMLRSVMQMALRTYPKDNIAFLQFSGMKVTFDSTLQENARIVSIRVGDKLLDFSDTKTTFTVAMPQELANGAAGYILLFDNKPLTETPTTLLEAITKEFTKQGGHIKPKVEDRLVDTKPKPEAAPAK
ncbi:MAG TPA: 5'-nucleotidase [Armatimonadota bacterium]|jgi:2',3'-cyclic-nucleotide 2'-phosphodiesterase (5'-nucleotidase family)